MPPPTCSAVGGVVVPTITWAEPTSALVFRPLGDPQVRFTTSVMWSPESAGTPGVRALLEAIDQLAAELGWR